MFVVVVVLIFSSSSISLLSEAAAHLLDEKKEISLPFVIDSTTIDTFMKLVIFSQQQQRTTTMATAAILSSNSSIVMLSLRRRQEQSLSSLKGGTTTLQQLVNNQTTIHMFSFDLESDDTTRQHAFKSSVALALSMHQIKPLKLVEVNNMLCDCILGNPFVDSKQIEFLTTTDRDIPKLIRQIREQKKQPFQYLQWSDFDMSILSPYEIQYIVSTSSFSNITRLDDSHGVVQSLKEDMISCLTTMKYCTTNNSSPLCYEKHDFCWLRRLQNFFELSQSEWFVNVTNRILSTVRKSMPTDDSMLWWNISHSLWRMF
ncbi:hypothetical protein FDP41_001896 [Naegleria fowleri]|uniref:Uncharacterized protein n=1 Tax=Naegleria fowleri TaxID=5763 RepID=A0A6A5BUB7_NAEFO|nr:uncharacterized protein FDP41_001896 [Naegleria fowleri]KAF0978826.1 hypothetical protein FDP41_001896 [Naegleria fowleri]